MDKKMSNRDELIGLQVAIKQCSDPTWVGRTGLVVDETKNTFIIEIDDQKKKIAKKTAIFEFDHHGNKIIIDGSKIMYRPEDRIKKIR